MIHATAQVHPDANLHPTVEVGPWCTIGADVIVGARTRLVSHVLLEGHTQLGEDNIVYPFSVLGSVPQDLKYRGEPTRLIVGDRNTIREFVTMNLGTVQGGGKTQVGNNCLIMAYTHLGHDCLMGNGCILANYAGLAGHVVLEDHVTLGGMVGVSQYVRLGAYAYVGGQSGLERDVPPFTIALGSRPTLLKGANIVGLKRQGFSGDRIQSIHEAIRLWTRSDMPKNECLEKMEVAFAGNADVQRFLQFIRESEVGVLR
jgi:UDP-N-acetylglucosamine acyltransferase